jgi:hypothetical protein
MQKSLDSESISSGNGAFVVICRYYGGSQDPDGAGGLFLRPPDEAKSLPDYALSLPDEAKSRLAYFFLFR